MRSLFFFNATATTVIYTLSLHDALPILHQQQVLDVRPRADPDRIDVAADDDVHPDAALGPELDVVVRGDVKDRKSTRLNSSHSSISYAVFCLKKKNKNINTPHIQCFIIH